MLYKLKKKKKLSNIVYVGDRINVMYRFKGVFFIITGICVFNREKNIGIYAKKKTYYTFFSILKKSIHSIKKLDTYYFNNIAVKMLRKNYFEYGKSIY